MYKNKKILAIITARKGSKRIRNKNLIKFGDRKLIEWTFLSAQKSKLIDKTYISTNDNRIIKLAKKYEIASLFKRPEHLSTDKAKTKSVLLHHLKWMKKNNYEKYEYIVLLQPTSPLRKGFHIDNAIKQIVKSNHNSLISVCASPVISDWIFKKSKQNKKYLNLTHLNKVKQSQNYEETFYLNGLIFIAKINYFFKHKSFFGNKTDIFKVPLEYSIDIDNHEDLKIGEYYLSRYINEYK